MSKRLFMTLFVGWCLFFVASMELAAQTNPYYKLNKRQRQERATELLSNYDAILEQAEEAGTEGMLKQELRRFGIEYDKKSNRALWLGIGGGLGIMIIGGTAVGVSSQSVGGALACVAAGIGGMTLGMIKSSQHRAKSRTFLQRSKDIIVMDEGHHAFTEKRLALDFGTCQLEVGTSLIHDNYYNQYAFGPSLIVSF